MSNEKEQLAISQRIRDWFQGEAKNHGWKASQTISDEIDALIASAVGPLPESAIAWQRWNEFEGDINNAGRDAFYIAVDMCKFTKWNADRELGLTDKPFEGVPRIAIRPR